MVALRSLSYALVFYSGTVAYVLAALLALAVAPARVRAVALGWCRFHRRCASTIAGVYSVVEGRLPGGPVLIAARHESFFETLEAPLLFGAPAIVAKRELIDLPLWGRAARGYGVIPVDRAGGAGALRIMLRAARTARAQGRSILIFPEGTRTPHGAPGPLQPGFAGLYASLQLPVVPVALDSGPRFRSFWKSAGPVRWHVGAAIAPGLSREELETRVAEAIRRFD